MGVTCGRGEREEEELEEEQKEGEKGEYDGSLVIKSERGIDLHN